jgi:hypothetical protein
MPGKKDLGYDLEWKLGFKAFDKNLKCNNFPYKIGKSYTFNKGKIINNINGIMFCKQFHNLFNRYPLDSDHLSRYCVILYNNKRCYDSDSLVESFTSEIHIIREMKMPELFFLMKNYENKSKMNEYNKSFCVV